MRILIIDDNKASHHDSVCTIQNLIFASDQTRPIEIIQLKADSLEEFKEELSNVDGVISFVGMKVGDVNHFRKVFSKLYPNSPPPPVLSIHESNKDFTVGKLSYPLMEVHPDNLSATQHLDEFMRIVRENSKARSADERPTAEVIGDGAGYGGHVVRNGLRP